MQRERDELIIRPRYICVSIATIAQATVKSLSSMSLATAYLQTAFTVEYRQSGGYNFLQKSGVQYSILPVQKEVLFGHKISICCILFIIYNTQSIYRIIIQYHKLHDYFYYCQHLKINGLYSSQLATYYTIHNPSCI